MPQSECRPESICKKIIYLIRHCNRYDLDEGENIWKKISLSLYDVPLSSKGVKMSFELAEHFKDIKIDAIYSSPYLRCVQTSYPLSLLKDKKIKIDNRLSEIIKPEWFNEQPKILTTRELFNFYPSVDLEYQTQELPIYPENQDGETYKLRINSLWKSIESSQERTIIIISHGAPLVELQKSLKLEYVCPQQGMIIHIIKNHQKYKIENVLSINAT
jgi:broad specificity phosphatase PhoE